MIINICGNDYFLVKVTANMAFNRKEERILKLEATEARATALENGYNPKTQQSICHNRRAYYSFSKIK